MRLIFLSFLSFVFTGNVYGQSLIAGWDFQTTSNGGTALLAAPNTPTLIQSNVGSGTLYLNGTQGSSVWNTGTSNNQLSAFTGTTLNAATGFSNVTSGAAALSPLNNSANGKSMVFAFSMTGFRDLQVSYATQRSSTGFTSQQWEYSTDTTNWQAWITFSISGSGSYTVQTSGVLTALNFAPVCFLRLTLNGASGSSGNNRFDNIQLNATPSVPPPVLNAATYTAQVGVPFSQTISATNNPLSFSASNLPDGLSMNTISGLISGIPVHANLNQVSTVVATNAGGSSTALITFSIQKGVQSIAWNAIAPATYEDPPLVLIATGGNSGNAIWYSSSDSGIASPFGNILQLNGAGTCSIWAHQNGNADYQDATPIFQTLTIAKAPQSIQFVSPGNKLITDAPFILNATGGNSGNPMLFQSSDTSILHINGNMATITGAGTVSITVQQSGNQNYLDAVAVSQNIVVSQLTQQISFSSIPVQMVGSTFTVNATGGASGQSIVFHSSDTTKAIVNGNTIQCIAAGVVLITATQEGNSIYLPATPVSQVLVMNGPPESVLYTFGSGTTASALPSSALPAHLSAGAVQQGNNANTSQSSINLSVTSVCTLPGSSSGFNAGITARNQDYDPDTSAYFSFSFQPSASYFATLQQISFNTRSTTTGPTLLDLRSSADNFSNVLASWTVPNTSSWQSRSAVLLPVASAGMQEFRIYASVPGGQATVGSGNANNWRIDDLQLQISVTPSSSCNAALQVQSNPVPCPGGSTTLNITPLNTQGSVSYSLNNAIPQNNSVFTAVSAGTYTVQLTDAFSCTATTIYTVTSLPHPEVQAVSQSACNGEAISLQGIPAGGSFSIANPYTGGDTTFTYSYTDSLGCLLVSSSAEIHRYPCMQLDLKLFIEGYYAGSQTMVPVLMNQGLGNTATVVDDITLELHDPQTYSLVYTQVATLHTNGHAYFSFPNVSGYFYLVIRHRNALCTWSALPVLLQSGNNSYDFTTSSGNTFGDNVKMVEPGVWALFSGDLNQDENIDLLDLNELENEIATFGSGFNTSDLNGDGNVDLLDFPLPESNSISFIASLHPVYILFPETMEAGIKNTYANATVALSTGSWQFNDALLGSSSSDHKNGMQCARLQNLGMLTMNFDVFVDTSVITISHARYGSDAASTWALFRSADGGNTWTQEGSTISTQSSTLQVAVFTILYSGTLRFQIRKLSGGKLNIDDFNITENTSLLFPENDALTLGNPDNASTDISLPDHYLLVKPQYQLSYNNAKGEANWVAWHLDFNDLGTTPRCDCFSPDAQLPSSFYKASASSYSGSGFDRGHQVPSSQRNNNITNNAATFLMTNMLPQAPNLNQITWNDLESYCTSLANNGYELYTYSGGYGSGGSGSNGSITYTISGTPVVVPSHCWKVVLILPNGTNDISRITSSTRVIAVAMPNVQSVNTQPWGNYRISVDTLESLTGFDFLSSLSTTLQAQLEISVDNGPVN